MEIDLFVISGEIDNIKSKVIALEKLVMEEPNAEDINWEKAQVLSGDIQDSAETLYNEIDDALAEA